MNRSCLVALVVPLIAFSLAAQAPATSSAAGAPAMVAGSGAPDVLATYGVTSVNVLTVPGPAFQPYDEGSSLLGFAGWGYIYRKGGSSPWFMAPVNLPTGASVLGVMWEVCDSSPTETIGGALFSYNASGGTYHGNYDFILDPASVPGCTQILDVFPAPVVIDNLNAAWALELRITGTDNSTRVGAARIAYQLQVSPAPGTASFADVPVGSALHQYVEALVAAGITAGCGGGNYCPNQAVTRGQIAVFLAKALGLHWAP